MFYVFYFLKGVTLKTESDGRMFPSTDDSKTIIHSLLETAKRLGIELVTRAKVMSLHSSSEGSKHSNTHRFDVSVRISERRDLKDGSSVVKSVGMNSAEVSVVKSAVKSGLQDFTCDSVLVCPGSSREVMKWLSCLGHDIVKPVPSLFTLNLQESKSDMPGSWLSGLAGISVENAILTLTDCQVDKSPSSSPSMSSSGPLLITHTGLSGPAALRLSAYGARQFSEAHYSACIEVNWLSRSGDFPKVLKELKTFRTSHLRSKLVYTFCPLTHGDHTKDIPSPSVNKRDKGVDSPILPKRLWDALLQHVGIPTDIRWASLSDEHVLRIATALLRTKVNMVRDIHTHELALSHLFISLCSCV